METEGPSSSPAPEPARDGDAPPSETTREDLERRLRLSESVVLELERALEGKCRSLDESTRAAESLRRELRAARAANEADGSVPAAAMDAARAEIEQLLDNSEQTVGELDLYNRSPRLIVVSSDVDQYWERWSAMPPVSCPHTRIWYTQCVHNS